MSYAITLRFGRITMEWDGMTSELVDEMPRTRDMRVAIAGPSRRRMRVHAFGVTTPESALLHALVGYEVVVNVKPGAGEASLRYECLVVQIADGNLNGRPTIDLVMDSSAVVAA
jgi:hypothetical protein